MGLVERLASLISGGHTEGRAERRQLAEEHAQLDGLFEEVRNRAAAGDWQECDAIWRRLCTELEDHFRFEEQQLWPEFGARSGRTRAEVEVLMAEHVGIRMGLDRIGVEIELKHVDRDAIEQLIAQLRAHASHENELFYPWVSAHSE